jgi:hypothetical protein
MKSHQKIFLIGFFSLIAVKSYSQCSGYLVGYFPDTVNGVTITTNTTGAVGTGSPIPTDTYTYCGVVSRTVSLGAGFPSAFTQTLNFSSPINNIVYILTASDCSSGVCESFSFTVNAGTLTCTQAGSACLFHQSGNNFIADTSGGLSNDAYITLSSTMSYTSITVTGPGGNNGSMMSLCASSITGIKNNAFNEQIQIYPNPVKNKINIEANQISQIKVFDLLGKETTSTKEKEIDVSNFSEGVYFIQVKTNQNTYTKKIIVQH